MLTLGEIDGSGVIRHIWLTPTGDWRSQILRIYWDGSDVPAVECPLGDFFACGWGQYAGTYMAWGVNNTGWWGEGEIKFYMDGDREYPTICGTARRIISAALIILKIRRPISIRPLRRPIPVCAR